MSRKLFTHDMKRESKRILTGVETIADAEMLIRPTKHLIYGPCKVQYVVEYPDGGVDAMVTR